MDDNAFLLHPDFLKKKKKIQHTEPPNFQANRANKPFIFFRPYVNKGSAAQWCLPASTWRGVGSYDKVLIKIQYGIYMIYEYKNRYLFILATRTMVLSSST